MKEVLKKLLIKELENTLEKIKTGTCSLSEEEMTDILSVIAHKELTKTQAAEYLHISRATFDNRIAAGELPKGRKVKHKNELIWYQDELVTK